MLVSLWLHKLFSAQNYSAFAGFGLVVWLAHFQFGSGSGGIWLLFYLSVSSAYLLIDTSGNPPLLPWEKVFLSILGFYVLILFLGGLQLPGGLFGRAFWRAFDNTSRFILLLPLYLAWRKTPISSYWLIAGACFGISTVTILQIMDYLEGARGTISVTGLHISQGASIAALGSLMLISAWSTWLKRHYIGTIMVVAFWFFALMSIILSGSRGAIFSIAVSAILTLVLIAKDSLRTSLSLMVILCTLVSIGYYALDKNQQNKIISRIGMAIEELDIYLSERNFSESVGARLMIWEGSVKIIASHPLGTGTNNFNYAINKLADGDQRYESLRHFGHAHNEFLNTAVENGWLGLLAIITLFSFAVLFFVRNHLVCTTYPGKSYSGLGAIFMISYFSSAMTQSLLSHHSTTLLLIIIMYFCCAQLRAQAHVFSTQNDMV